MLAKMLGKLTLASVPLTSNLFLAFQRIHPRQLILRSPGQPMIRRRLSDTSRESKDSLKNCMKTCKSGLCHVPKYLLVLRVDGILDMSI